MTRKALTVFGIVGSLLLGCSLAHADKRPNAYNTPQQRQEYEQRHQKFQRLWRSRRQRNVTRPMLAMLNSERTPHLRTQIVVALGRLEDAPAEPSLKALLTQVRQGQGWRNQIPLYSIQLSLGRIRSRKLHGAPKLNVIAQSVGTTWPGVKHMAARLRKQLGSVKTRRSAVTSEEYQIIEEFIDVLYRMGKRGENIQKLGGYEILLWPQQKPMLTTSAFSDKAEARFWLQRALPPSKVGFYPHHLLDLGPTVPDELMKYLRIGLAKAKAKPEIMRDTSAYRSMFKAAAATGDKRFLPILKEFMKVNDRWTRIDAGIAIEQLQRLS